MKKLFFACTFALFTQVARREFFFDFDVRFFGTAILKIFFNFTFNFIKFLIRDKDNKF